jgi:hypothetical protein
MPELDGTQVVAIASFAALVLAWLFAPTSQPVAVERRLPAAA